MNVNQENGQNEIVFDRCTCPLSILLLAAIGAKLIGPHGGLQVDEPKVGKVTGYVDAPNSAFISIENMQLTVYSSYNAHCEFELPENRH